jgi:glutamine amidotransferase
VLAVLDYGIGNLRSAEKALLKVGGEARLVTTAEEAQGAEGVVLPGVGAFAACATALRASGLDKVVAQAVEEHVPLLGVCVGYQLLFEGSEEDPAATGLGLLQGRVRRLPPGVKLPQMQWNTVQPTAGSALFDGLGAAPWFYFVHSYAPVPEGAAAAAIAGTADYGGSFAAAIELDSLAGVQFHPEKSGRDGLALLAGFVARCAAASCALGASVGA